ncbi:hypothetical protein ACFYUK_09090 [Nonomuraea wenchangensis]
MEVESSICLSDLVPALRWSRPQQVAEALGDPRLPAGWWSSLPLSKALGTAGLDWICERLGRLATARWDHLPLSDLVPALTVHPVDPALPGWPEATRTAVIGLGGWQRLRRLSPSDLSTPSATPEVVVGAVLREILGRIPALPAAGPAELTRPVPRGADGAEEARNTGSFPAVPSGGPFVAPSPNGQSGPFPAPTDGRDAPLAASSGQSGPFPAPADGRDAPLAASSGQSGPFAAQPGGQSAPGAGQPGGQPGGQGNGLPQRPAAAFPGRPPEPPAGGQPGEPRQTGSFPAQSGDRHTGSFPSLPGDRQAGPLPGGQQTGSSPAVPGNRQAGPSLPGGQQTGPSPAVPGEPRQTGSFPAQSGAFAAQPQNGALPQRQTPGQPPQPGQQSQPGQPGQPGAGGLPQRPAARQPGREETGSFPAAPGAAPAKTGASPVPFDADHAMVRVVDNLFRGLDKLELAVAVHRLFAEDPISLRTLAHKLLVERESLSHAQRTAEERVLTWLRSSESAPVTGHMFRLTEWLGAAATEEQLIGADPAHPVMVPSLRTPLWRVLVTLMPDRRLQDGWLVVGDIHGLQARTRQLLASAPPDADVVELMAELGIRAHSAKAWLDALPPESADPMASAPSPAQPLPRRTPGANGHHHRGGQPIPSATSGSIDPSAALATLSALSGGRSGMLPAGLAGAPATPPPPLPSPSSDPRRWQRIEVTPEHLRGGPVPVPEGYAAQLGMRPGTLLSVTGPGDNAIVLVWQGHQPVFDSLLPVLMRLNARPGDQVYVTVDGYRLEAQLTG